MSWATHRQCVIDGDDAGPQGLHVLVIFKPVLLPRGVILVNCALWKPWARRRRWRYLCARRSWTSWCQVDLRLVPDQVVTPPGTALMGSMSITAREAIAPKSLAEAPPTSAVRGGVSTLALATGGEAALPSAAPLGGVAVRASSSSASPTTCGSGDLVREGEDGAPCSPCGLVTGLHGKTSRKGNNLQDATSKEKLARLYLVAAGVEFSAKILEA
jgi:hypothetical protein